MSAKESARKACQKWRVKNKIRHASYVYNKQRHYNEIMRLYKNRPCMDCGGWFNPWQMDFDHRNPKEKDKQISSYFSCALRRAWNEIKKCDLVCANCHRERTHNRYAFKILSN